MKPLATFKHTVFFTALFTTLTSCSIIEPRKPISTNNPLQATITPANNDKQKGTIWLLGRKARSSDIVGSIRFQEQNECIANAPLLISTTDKQGYIKYWEFHPHLDHSNPIDLTLTYLGTITDVYQYALTINNETQIFTSSRAIQSIRAKEGDELNILITE